MCRKVMSMGLMTAAALIPLSLIHILVKQYPELERGESASQTGREHIPPRIFKEMTQLTCLLYTSYFAYALKFLEGRQRPDTFLSAVVHMDEKTPHLHLCFVPLTPDGRLSAKEIIGNRKNLVRWQDEFWQHMVKQYPELERGESASQTGREHIPVSYTHLDVYKRQLLVVASFP